MMLHTYGRRRRDRVDSWEFLIFQYIPRFTDPAHVIENEELASSAFDSAVF